MFESAELGHRIDDAAFKKRAARLRADLLDAQYDLIEAKRFPLIILINGVDGAGKGETVNVLNEWMDTRHIVNHAFDVPTEEERARPPMWRFWRALPPKGKTGILFGNWYTDPILKRVSKTIDKGELTRAIDEINRFEKLLCDDGALVLKFWFHLSKRAQHKRLTDLEKDKDTRWRVTKRDWDHFNQYNRFAKVSEQVLRRTNSVSASWSVVEGADANYRTLTVADQVLRAIREKLAEKAPRRVAPKAPAKPVDNVELLRTFDTKQSLSKERFEKMFPKLLRDLNKVSRAPALKERAVVAVFEGMDAGGKGGAIRRVTQALDARRYHVIQISAPSEEERAQPYLWRFWRHVPSHGRFSIFDRSWYGRVLVERVEGFCSPNDWGRAYDEINDFEHQLHKSGIVVVKFWLAVSKEEQLRRFKEREQTRFKRFKITSEDWRNRKKWDAYVDAASDMIDRTSTSYAPWTLVAADDKHFARKTVLTTLTEAIKRAEKH